MRLLLTAAAVSAALAAAVPMAIAQSADPGVTARAIQDGCVRRREDARVCACGVGVAYSSLEPAVFALIPRLDPLIDEPDRTKQISGLLTVATQSRLNVQQVQAAYDTIRANRATVRTVCNPLAAKAK